VVVAASYYPPSEFALPIYMWRSVTVLEHVQAYLDGLYKHAFIQSPPPRRHDGDEISNTTMYASEIMHWRVTPSAGGVASDACMWWDVAHRSGVNHAPASSPAVTGVATDACMWWDVAHRSEAKHTLGM
jgi:hypothetical protein